MNSSPVNPYDAPRELTMEPPVSEGRGSWSLQSLAIVAVVTGIGGVVAYQFITDEPQTLPNGIVTVNASLEVAMLSAVLSGISAVALLKIRRRSKDDFRRWQAIGLPALALVVTIPAAGAFWNYILPFCRAHLRVVASVVGDRDCSSQLTPAELDA